MKPLEHIIETQQTENSANEAGTTDQFTNATIKEQQPTLEMAPLTEQELQHAAPEWPVSASQWMSPTLPLFASWQDVPQPPFPQGGLQSSFSDSQAAYWNYLPDSGMKYQGEQNEQGQQYIPEQYAPSQQYWQQLEQYLPPQQYWQPPVPYQPSTIPTSTTGMMAPILPSPANNLLSLSTTQRPLRPQRQKSNHLRIIIALCSVMLLVLAATVARFLLVRTLQPHTTHTATKNGHVSATTTGSTVLNTITNNKTISPLIFGTNMALYQNGDEPLINSPQTRTALQNIGVRIIRMPTRATLSDQTEIQAAEAIKAIGAVPLVVMNGPEFHQGSVLQSDEHLLHLISSVFGTQTVYYEFGNEADLQGITVQQYVQVWNQVVPQLKHDFPGARFLGPGSYQFSLDAIKTFVQEAQPRPDGISWHEYTCSIQWTAQLCLDNINTWTTHITQAREAMQQAIGKALPIWITEWNYASDTNDQLVWDGKANNPAFLQAWTLKAMQTLIANRVFASMQYFATSNPMPLVKSNGQLGSEGKVFQQEYEKVMVHGYTPPVAP